MRAPGEELASTGGYSTENCCTVAATPSAAAGSVLTVERGLYVMIAIAALAVRLIRLGSAPLLYEELPTALAATQLLRGLPIATQDYLPLLLNGQLAFLTPHTSTTSVRLWTALCGGLLPLLAYRERQWLGRIGALAAAGFTAFSPTWVYAGRTADGAVVAVTLSLLGMGLLRRADNESPRRGLVGMALLGCALTAGPQSLSIFVAVLGAALLSGQLATMKRVLGQRAAIAGRQVPVLAVLGLTWALVSTTFLLLPGGIGAGIELIARWFVAADQASSPPLLQAVLVQAVYEPVVLVLGLYGLVTGSLQRKQPERMLGWWLLIALLLTTLFGHRSAQWTITFSLPLTLLAGRAVQRLVESGSCALDRYGATALAAGAVFATLTLVSTANALRAPNLAWMAWLGLALLLATLVAYGIWSTGRSAMKVAVALLLCGTLALSLRGTVALAWDRARDPYEPLLRDSVSAQVGELEPLLQSLSVTYSGDPRSVSVVYEQALEPYLAWSTREYPNARSTVRVSEHSGAPILISTARADGQGPAGYVVQGLILRDTLPTGGRSVTQAIQWLLQRQRGPVATDEQIQIWVKLQSGGQDGE
ncbi:MAG: hypothetical protein ACOX2L_05390 [Anaerolineae bacterium]|jgi:predicted membrane-bound mannosyltransferase|nr:hypothetical protein [Chloroflexota bacterium]